MANVPQLVKGGRIICQIDVLLHFISHRSNPRYVFSPPALPWMLNHQIDIKSTYHLPLLPEYLILAGQSILHCKHKETLHCRRKKRFYFSLEKTLSILEYMVHHRPQPLTNGISKFSWELQETSWLPLQFESLNTHWIQACSSGGGIIKIQLILVFFSYCKWPLTCKTHFR